MSPETTPRKSPNHIPDGTVFYVRRGGEFRAYDADTLKKKLAEITSGSWTTKGTFTDPTIIDGRVYVGSDGKVTVLGLDPALGPA